MTRDTVNTLSVKLEMMDKNQQEIKQDMKDIKEQLNTNMWAFIAKLEQLEQKLEQKYASKRTESALKRVITIVFTGVVGALLKLVIIW